MSSRERRAERRQRFAQLELVQQRIIKDWMSTEAETWVSTVGIDERAEVVTVSLNRHDPDYAERLVAAFGDDNVRIEPNPSVVTALPPAPAQPPVLRRETRQPPPRR